MTCPYCTATLPDGSRLCQSCGRLLAPTAPPPTPQQPQPHLPWPNQQPPVPGPAGPRPVYAPPAPAAFSDPYHPLFDVRQLPPDVTATYRQHRFHATFSVLVSLLIHFLTFGLASPFMVTRKFSLLPRIKPNDFTTARAAGFLFIPFFNFYWIFIVCHRIVDRLALQSKLWGVAGPPSKGMATSVATLWLISGLLGSIPIIGGLIGLSFYGVLWPIYHAQIQATCNRLALAAAPQHAHAAMLQLERWTRQRWLGWMLLSPALLLIAGTVGALIAGTEVSRAGATMSLFLYGLLAIGGVALLYFGSHSTREVYHSLSGVAPLIVAGYLRIDKIAAWVIVWLAAPTALLLLLTGISTLAAPTVDNPAGNAWTVLGLMAAMTGFAVYATYKALQLKGQIGWLESAAATPAPGYGSGTTSL